MNPIGFCHVFTSSFHLWLGTSVAASRQSPSPFWTQLIGLPHRRREAVPKMAVTQGCCGSAGKPMKSRYLNLESKWTASDSSDWTQDQNFINSLWIFMGRWVPRKLDDWGPISSQSNHKFGPTAHKDWTEPRPFVIVVWFRFGLSTTPTIFWGVTFGMNTLERGLSWCIPLDAIMSTSNAWFYTP
jgi:hypothetical protein